MLAVLLISCTATALTAYAISYFSLKRQNEFQPTSLNIQIEENDDTPEDTKSRKILKFTLTQDENYTTNKKIEIHNVAAKDDEYVRVKLIPNWVMIKEDEEGNETEFICANLGSISDFYNQSLNENRDSLIVYNTLNQPIVTYVLNSLWETSWVYNNNDGCFYHKGTLENGTASTLIDNVIITSEVYQDTEDYSLTIDVLADAVQQYGNVSDNRNNENWRISYE